MFAILWLLAVISPSFAVMDTGFLKPEQVLAAAAEVNIPLFPTSFEMSYSWTLPSMDDIQPGGLSYPVKVYVDAVAQKSRVDVYDAMDYTITTRGYSYTSSPRLDERICMVSIGGPIANSGETSSFLPDLTEGWVYQGVESSGVSDESYNVFTYTHEDFERTQEYKFWVTLDGVPHKLSVYGQDFWSGSHFDVYLAEWHSFTPGTPDPSVFDLPPECQSMAANPVPTEGPLANAHLAHTALLPTVGVAHAQVGKDAEFDAFVAKHGRQVRSQQEYHFRRGVFAKNAAFVREWNAENERRKQEDARANRKHVPRHTVALNHFADWSEEEFRTIALGRLRREDNTVEGENAANEANYYDTRRRYRPEVEASEVPEELSYRGLPQYSPVKDQASCGSCWAFGTSVALQAAWYKATGESVSISEQQMVDCSWDYWNYGCNGGLQDRAINYIVQAGGIASEQDYKYLGQNGYCGDTSTPMSAKFKGYVMIPPRNHAAVREALYSQGPLAVGIDAAHESFRFYLSGVYYNTECCLYGTSWCIDHLVGLVGYGEEDGLAYYEIQNSWSPYWGDEGFMKVAVDYDCGISLEATYAIADTSSV